MKKNSNDPRKISGTLIVQRGKNEAILYGILSLAVGCYDSKLPPIYTNVVAFRNWIDQATPRITEYKSKTKPNKVKKPVGRPVKKPYVPILEIFPWIGIAIRGRLNDSSTSPKSQELVMFPLNKTDQT